jgi:ribosomal peptide maturation radical SAM protein 1
LWLKRSIRWFRGKSPARVLAQLDELHRRYGVASFFFTDNILNMDYFKSLIPELKHYNYRIFFEVKANLQEKHIRAFRQAGITCIQPGIESLHSEILSLMNKGLKTYQVIELLKWCRQYGVFMIWFILYNFPEEDDKHYQEMAEYIPLLAHLQPPDAMMQVIFSRCSDYHLRAKDYGLKLQPPKIFNYVYPLRDEELGDVVSYFDEERRLQLLENKFLQMLIPYDGRKAVYTKVQAWKQQFSSDQPAMLSMSIAGEAVHISDSRPIATRPAITLSGLAAKIYLACNEANTIDKLHELSEEGSDKEKIDDILAKLLEQKIMIKVDGRFLALAVVEPFFPLMTRSGERFVNKYPPV